MSGCDAVIIVVLQYISFSIQVVWQPIAFSRCNAVMHIGKLQLSETHKVKQRAAAAFRWNDLTSLPSVAIKKDLKPGCEVKSLETDILRGMCLLEEALPQSSSCRVYWTLLKRSQRCKSEPSFLCKPQPVRCNKMMEWMLHPDQGHTV